MFATGLATGVCFSALQRAEIAEIGWVSLLPSATRTSFSALQRAEIAEMLLYPYTRDYIARGFSALQRAEIAEILNARSTSTLRRRFQCSSTSRNC